LSINPKNNNERTRRPRGAEIKGRDHGKMQGMFPLSAALWLSALLLPAAVYDVKNYGDVNKAIEAAAAAGGGTVYFPPGTYVTGSIRLRSNITVQFERGAEGLSKRRRWRA
jgi:hypothetical protein